MCYHAELFTSVMGIKSRASCLGIQSQMNRAIILIHNLCAPARNPSLQLLWVTPVTGWFGKLDLGGQCPNWGECLPKNHHTTHTSTHVPYTTVTHSHILIGTQAPPVLLPAGHILSYSTASDSYRLPYSP